MTVTRYKRQKATGDAIREAVLGIARHTPKQASEAPKADKAAPATVAKTAPSAAERAARTVGELLVHHQEVIAEPRQPMRVSPEAMAKAKRQKRSGRSARDEGPFHAPGMFKPYQPPPGVLPKGTNGKEATADMAMDSGLQAWADNSFSAGWNNANPFGAAFAEGIGFLGYAYLSELTQRAEYRRMSERIATEMTRKWIRLTVAGEADPESEDDKDSDLAEDRAPDAPLQDEEDLEDEDLESNAATPDVEEDDEPTAEEKAQRARNEALQKKILKIEDDMKRLDIRGKFKKIAEHCGWYGCSHLYVDTGDSDDVDELMTDLGNGSDRVSKEKFKKGSLKNIRAIEPIWCYPVRYNSVDPLKDDWYTPDTWFVMAKQVHKSRLMTFVSREVPDILKPAYNFGGLSMSQMAKPYVDNWLRTRQAVTALIESFSVSGVYTNAQSLLQGGGEEVLDRIDMFNVNRANSGCFVLDKDTEEFFNISTPLGSLDQLQAQSQEHMCVQGGTLIRTARGNIPIEEVRLSDEVLTRDGLRPIKWVGVTDHRDTFIEIKVGGSVLRVTEEHPVWSESTREFVNAANVSPSHCLLVLPSEGSMALQSLGEADGGGKPNPAIIAIKKLAVSSIRSFGRLIVARFLGAKKFITSMRTAQTISSIISKCLTDLSTVNATLALSAGPTSISAQSVVTRSPQLTDAGCFVPAHAKPELGRSREGGCLIPSITSCANAAGTTSSQSRAEQDFALARARSVQVGTVERLKLPKQSVYNIEVDGRPEFFANDVLVHNSSVSGIPLIVLLGITPQGLNASSEGELRVFYDMIHAEQESQWRDKLKRVIDFIQLHLFGEVDPAIGFEFEPLWSLDEKGEAEVKKMKADTHQVYVDMGSFSPEEVRGIEIADDDSPYNGLDPDDMPEAPAEEGLLGPGAGGSAKEFEAEHSAGGDTPDRSMGGADDSAVAEA